ncbi:hypothetical protein O181_028003 [Austropuccinia psidii MF-1]|uniref:Uncharacterized protein n=1 Tax=Austropuccinia psidii MF-1 TaxID=1389203 RepID=A0A9Q3H1E9_9BASI|nr:hypothetical protein [Austropuccinia psidii MF-1]
MKEGKGKGRKSVGQQPALTDKLVSKRSNSMFGVLERKLDTQDNQMLQQLRNNPQFNYDHDKIANDHKLLELKENRERAELEIKWANNKRANKEAEDGANQARLELEETSKRTRMEFDLKQQELEQNNRRMKHEIGKEVRAERLAAIKDLQRDGLSSEEIENALRMIFNP